MSSALPLTESRRCRRDDGRGGAAEDGVRLAARRMATAASLALLGGCVVVPVTRNVYDADCRMMRREVRLETAVVGQFHSCGGAECSALLATLGVVSAATLVVSGSLAIVGNVVYWLEHEANCRQRATPGPPGAQPAPGPSGSG